MTAQPTRRTGLTSRRAVLGGEAQNSLGQYGAQRSCNASHRVELQTRPAAGGDQLTGVATTERADWMVSEEGKHVSLQVVGVELDRAKQDPSLIETLRKAQAA